MALAPDDIIRHLVGGVTFPYWQAQSGSCVCMHKVGDQGFGAAGMGMETITPAESGTLRRTACHHIMIPCVQWIFNLSFVFFRLIGRVLADCRDTRDNTAQSATE